ncbi:thiol-activated cytolysin family protein [Sediminicola luteus]|uniref:Thiol-activated cytolysin n=1 Tax=Sediminicola luteus TaxID=319238 RepID=A0A2A4G776_9FLAO|nr:thiol-activated cytolysin family protein [Sediminicola luteus]PCE63804.1 hypothetical protein B7P33_11075 [Sediminicola luteus]
MKTLLVNSKLKKMAWGCLVIVTTLFGCSKSDDGGGGPLVDDKTAAEHNAVLASLSEFEQGEEVASPTIVDEATERDTENESLECFITQYKHAPGFSELLALDPTSDVIYPGAMLKGESIPTGEYIGINGGRAPITLSISLENINGDASVEVSDPKLSTVRNGIKDLLAQGVSGATPAKLNLTTDEVYSEQHLNLAIGANYRSKNKNVSAAFDFNKTTKKHKYLVKFFQLYYSIDLDLPTNNNPGSLFTELPELNSTSPVIVSSVKYGRMVLYSVESDYSRSDVHGAFNASYRSTDGSISASDSTIIKNSNVKALVIGGSGASAAQVIDGPSGVFNYIKEGGNYSQDSPAAPLAYTLRYLKNDLPVARVVLASEYNIRNCELAYYKYKVKLLSMQRNDDKSGNFEVYGYIGARMILEDNDDKEKIVYMKDPDDPKDVLDAYYSNTRSNHIPVDKKKVDIPGQPEVEFEMYRPSMSGNKVNVYAKLSDKDLFSDDLIGKGEVKITLNDINSDLISGDEELLTETLKIGKIDVEYTVEKINLEPK